MEVLPNEVIVEIMLNLPFKSFQNMGVTCKRFQEIYKMSSKRYRKLYPYIFDLNPESISHKSILKGKTLLSQKINEQWFHVYIEHENVYKITFYRSPKEGSNSIYYPDDILQKYIESQELEKFVKSPVTFLSEDGFLKLKEFFGSKNIKIAI